MDKLVEAYLPGLAPHFEAISTWAWDHPTLAVVVGVVGVMGGYVIYDYMRRPRGLPPGPL